ncbi:ATPase, T2SS/T4P/T4SS family [Pelomicrobium methylotrophicum]|nr:ATPase, T2SS/T4P/T4SS family [Pelomicrobium methylotrophicum]
MNTILSQRAMGVNVTGFRVAITEPLRQRPDVIAIGEVPDHDTVEAILRTADYGHLVIVTMHTRNVCDFIGRFLGFYAGHEYHQKLALLASSLIGVVLQALMASSDESRYVLATELLVNNPASASYIREGKIHMLRNLIRQGRSDGMHTLNQSLAQLIAERRIALMSAFYVSYDDAELAQLTGKSAHSGRSDEAGA